MKNLQDVLQFIKNADKSELEFIKSALSIRKTDDTYDFKSSLKVGDNVSINHKKVSKNRMFFVIKINGVNIKVGEVGSEKTFTVTPSLLTKV